MTLLEIFLVGVGLSMDAFAVAICKGLAMPRVNRKRTLLIGLYFGVFQAVMPLTGWLLGSQFARHVTKMAPWIAFVLLAWIGGSMIRESLSTKEEEEEKPEPAELRHRELLMLAIATSQFFAVLTDLRSVGVMGDERTYDYTLALRAVQSQDFMTATWSRLPYELLDKVSGRIVGEVKHINRICYDITSKPPATVEWE